MARLPRLLAATMLMALSASQGENPFGTPTACSKYNKDVKPAPKKALQTFTVKGESIKAYSRKDAIKRYNHRNK